MTEKTTFLGEIRNLKSHKSLNQTQNQSPKTKCTIMRKHEGNKKNMKTFDLFCCVYVHLKKKATEKDGDKKKTITSSWLLKRLTRKKMWRMWANIYDLGLF